MLLFLIEHAPAEALAARRAVDHPRRGLLLRAAGADQDHERRLGQLLAFHHHDREGPGALGSASITPTITPAPWPPHRGRLNPYKLGIELLRDIEHRWNTGKFGKEYDECDDLEKRRNWNKKLGLGRKKIFEVRRVHNDITFIDTFLTPEFCQEHKMFSYAFQEQGGNYVIESREFEKIKQRLLVQPDELRQAVDLRGGRQLPQPRRTAAAARAQRRRSAAGPGGRHAGQPPVHLEPAGPPANRRRRQAQHAVLRRLRTFHPNLRRSR